MSSPTAAYLDTSLTNGSFVASRKKGGGVKTSRKTLGFSLTPAQGGTAGQLGEAGGPGTGFGLGAPRHRGGARGSLPPGGAAKPGLVGPSKAAFPSAVSILDSHRAQKRYQRNATVNVELASSIQGQSKSHLEARNIQLPDIIRMSHANLKDLSNLSTSRQRDFINRFQDSVNIRLQEETNYERAVARGKRKQPLYTHKVQASAINYTDATKITSLEPSNLAKTKYLKQFGSTEMSS